MKALRRSMHRTLAIIAVAAAALAGCGGPIANDTDSESEQPNAPSIRVFASIQELMEGIVDPNADAVWDAVGVTLTPDGSVEHRPQSDEEWRQLRLHAVALVEATNLLMMAGRRIVPDGGKIADEGEEGVLSTVEAENLFKTQNAAFVQMAAALHDVAEKMVTAIDSRRTDEILEVGETLDQVCESCHTTFWYPRQPVYRMTRSEGGTASR